VSVFLSELVTRTRRLADIENVTDRFPDDEVLAYVNRGLARWHRTLAQVFPNFFLQQTGNLTVVSGANSIDISSGAGFAGFLSIARLQYKDSSSPSGWRHVLPVQFDEIEQFSSSQSMGRPRGYMMAKDRILLFPEDAAAGVYRLWYIEGWGDLGIDETIEEWDDWLQLAVLDAAIAIKRKGEEDVSDLVQERAMLEAEVRAAAVARDVGATPHTTNVQDDETDWRVFR
jgi:hypothetical protein